MPAPNAQADLIVGLRAAVAVRDRLRAALDAEMADERRQIAEAVRDHSSLADNHWHKRNHLFVQLRHADALIEALRSVA